MKSIQWEPSCSMRTDRHDEANSRFSNCVNAPNDKILKYTVNVANKYNVGKPIIIMKLLSSDER